MWHYFLGHHAYHWMRLLNSLKVRKYLLIPVLIIVGIAAAGPHLYLWSLEYQYVMRCPFPLSTLMLTSLLFSTILLVFVIVFTAPERVGHVVKVMFHVFGFADGIYGIIYLYYNYKIYVCMLSAWYVFSTYSMISFLYVCSFKRVDTQRA